MINFPSEQSIRASYVTQRQLAQLHRWIALQIDPTADNAELTAPDLTFSLDGSPSDADSLSEALRTYPPGHLSSNDQTWNNPCTTGPETSSSLAARFDTSELPLLTNIAMTRSTASANAPQPSAAPHRILALKHRWHAIVEAPEKTPAALQELIAPTFDMQWGYGGLSGFTELSGWLTKSAASMDAARHDIAAFSWQPTGSNTYQAEFDFVWYGYSSDLEPMHAESRHTWQIEDEPEERYPRIRQMSVEFITPFHKVSGVNHD